ncbi:ABC transporter substrate-binding protein [Alkalihalobacillus sp. BA299]|uniref:ABC transporter substrate-binding protein n=1 Tax=Alkalihalobacillus sp. BA299 TaxID=2815938 RepID=UPI001AD9F31C|nr:ABC transporter substrate-binding protein [Alkalihalobacillus sp. BA299]
MNKSISILRIGMTLFILILVLAGCSGTSEKTVQETEATDPKNQTLTMAYTWNPAGLDVHGSDSWHIMRSGAAETLIGLNEQLEPIPWLAKEWHQEEDTVWMLKLEENVMFHNGDKMDAESVKASLLRSLEINQRANDLLDVQSIEVVGPSEIKIVTNNPNATLIPHLADPSTIILDVTTIDEVDTYPALTGPFKIKEFTKDDSLVVERYEEYWGENALLAEVTMKFMTDGNSRLMALQSGAVDVATDLPLDSISLIEREDHLEVLSAPSLRTHMILYNMNSPLFQNLALRQVVDLAIPREAIIHSVMMGYGTEANSPFADVLPFGDVPRTIVNQSINQLMGEAGWQKNKNGMWEKDGNLFEFTLLTFPQRPELTVMAEIIQAELLQEGIQAHIRQVENIDDTLESGNWDLAMYSMLTAHTGDPQYFLNIFYQSNSSSNVSYYTSAELDELLDRLNQTLEQIERDQLARQIQEIINNDIPQSFVVHPMTVFGSKKDVKGFTVHPIEYYYIHSRIERE